MAGHRPGDVWGYSPREIAAWLELARRRREVEMADTLALNALAAQGAGKDIQKRHRELADG